MKDCPWQKEMSFEQAGNYLDQVIKKQDPKKLSLSMPIGVDDVRTRENFLKKCIAQCPSRKHQLVLYLRGIHKMSLQAIALALCKNGFPGTTPVEVRNIEVEAIRIVKDRLVSGKRREGRMLILPGDREWN